MGGFRSGPIPGPPGPASELIALETVTDLRDTVPGVADAVAVLNEPGRKGLFAFDSTPAVDDGGTRFNIGGLGSNQPGWNRIYDGPLDIRWFGAVGDGVTDSTASIQLALDKGYGSNQPVWIPEGRWVTSAPLTVRSTSDNSLQLLGSGHSSHIISTLAADQAAIQTAGGTFEDFILRDVRISGSFSRGIDITAASGSNVRVEGCWVSGAVLDTPGNTATIAGIATGGLDDVWIVDNVISDNGKSLGVNLGKGYDILKRSGSYQSRIHIQNNNITGLHTYACVILFDSADSDVTNNTIDQGNTCFDTSPGVHEFGYGIAIYDTITPAGNGNARRNVISLNRVNNCGGMGVYLADSYDTVVGTNIVHDTCKTINEPSLPHAGIVANRCNVAVTGNDIKTTGSGSHGVAITYQSSSVTGNVIEAVSAAVHIDGPADRSTIVGNTSKNNTHGVLVSAGSPVGGMSITGNAFLDTSVPINATGALSESSIIGNTISGASNPGIFINAGTRNTIASNTIRNGLDWGIRVVSGADNQIITGNHVNSQASGILVAANNVLVADNDLTGVTVTPLSVTGTGSVQRNNRNTTNAAGYKSLQVNDALTLDAACVATFNNLSASQIVVTDGSKQLASLPYASANTVSAVVQRDAAGKIFVSTARFEGLNPSEALVLNASRDTATVPYTSTATANAIVQRGASAEIACNQLNATAVNVSGLSASQAVVTDGSKNLASLAYDTAATASTLVKRDASGGINVDDMNAASAVVTGNTNTATLYVPNGGTLPTTGVMRVANAFSLYGRDTGGNDARLLLFHADNGLYIGSQSFNALINLSCAGEISLNSAGFAGVRVDNTGAAAKVGFYGGTPIAKPSVTGALSSITDANAKAVLQSLINALKTAAGGVSLISDGTT